jgi:MFS family permease
VILTPITFFVPGSLSTLYLLATINGFFTLGQFAWMPIYLPELFPTLARGTASSFVFSTTRYLAAFGPLISGILVSTFGGYGIASTIFAAVYLLALPALLFLPETTGQPLPK